MEQMRRWARTTPAIFLPVFTLATGWGFQFAHGQPSGDLSPQCANLDVTSAESLFQCMGTIRHRNGTSEFANLDGRRCAEISQQLFRAIGRIADFRDEAQPVPSCDVVAEASWMMTGHAQLWSACTGYPSADPSAHMRACMAGFAPAYHGTDTLPEQYRTCEGFLDGYELALKFANERHNQQVPEGYVPPDCGTVNAVIAEITGEGPQWAACTDYDPSAVREHLLACVAANPDEVLGFRDCGAVREAYEQRLRESHGGLPADYVILSCADAQAVLDVKAEIAAAEEARRIAEAEAADRARQEAAERDRARLQAARDRILAEREARGPDGPACDPGPNLHPDHPYGEAITALETSCFATLSSDAQLFLAGLGEGLLRNCGLPENPQDRMRVAKFVADSMQVAIGGREYGNPDLGDMMRDQIQSQTDYAAGAEAFRALGGCGRPAPEIAHGLARYLEDTAARSNWVDGCEFHYATLYSRSQCQCTADKIRAIDPGVHDRPFARDDILALIQSNPLLGVQVGLECGISDY